MAKKDLPQILCVDDEPKVLSGLKLQLRGKFIVHTAASGQLGLQILEENKSIPVVVSDMRMPEMDGAAFLSAVRQRYPNTIRLLLTGQADLESAVAAVNEGQIFRFMMKPCPTDMLLMSLNAAVEQHRLLNLEKELLEKTLQGSIKVLTDILSLINPIAFSRSSRVRRFVAHMVGKLNLPNKWQFNLAAMLSQVGCVTVPAEVLAKVYASQALDDEEQILFDSHPTIGHELIAKIPRLKLVAEMIRYQRQTKEELAECSFEELDNARKGGVLLKVALGLDRQLTLGEKIQSGLNKLRMESEEYPAELLDLLMDVQDIQTQEISKLVNANELTSSMTIDEDIRGSNGALLVSKGQDVTEAISIQLKAVAANKGLQEPFRVVIHQ